MKKIRLYILTLTIPAIMGVLIMQTGCEKENGTPYCSITFPKNGENIPHGSMVVIMVDAGDLDGNITGVNFYIDNSSKAISNSYPYTYEWNALYEEVGSHSIKAIATDNIGNTTSDEITISVSQGVPKADFKAYQTSTSIDSSAYFYDQSINNPGSWIWDFGDGNTSNLQNPTHIYRTAGAYTVSLSVTNKYGSDSKTKSAFISVTGTLTDYDGNVYPTVRIGNQLWMKENLKTTHYADGTALIDGVNVGDISGDYTTKYNFVYNDDESYATAYGRLYTWAAAMNGVSGSETNPSHVQGVCPVGWHLPSDDEWKELEMFLGMSNRDANSIEWRGTDQGTKLKEASPGRWNEKYTVHVGTNESGFKALPGGSRWYNESYRHLRDRANFWSATEILGSYAWCRRLYYYHPDVYRFNDYKSRGYSVRCVKD